MSRSPISRGAESDPALRLRHAADLGPLLAPHSIIVEEAERLWIQIRVLADAEGRQRASGAYPGRVGIWIDHEEVRNPDS
jgi:hypothetical protein